MKPQLFLLTLRRLLPLVLLTVALGTGRTLAATSNPPQLMSYQGYLTDANGNALGSTNVGPKNYNVVFRIWDLQTGGVTNGSDELYAEQQTVTVNNGYFSVQLGQGSPVAGEPHTNLLSGLFLGSTAASRYVELTVLGIGVSGGNLTLAPRLQYLSSPYAFLAANAVTAASAASLVNPNNINAVSVTTNNYVGIGTSTPGYNLEVAGSAGLDGTLNVGGATVLGSTLNVSGAAVLDSTLNVSGAAALGSTLNVSGAAGFLNNLSVNGQFSLGGTLNMSNAYAMYARNTSGTLEAFFWPRFSDNCTYLDYGSAGFYIRNDTGTPVMWMGNNGNVGIGTTSPNYNLEVSGTVGFDTNASAYALAVGAGGFEQNSVAPFYIDAPNYIGGRLTVTAAGYVGIGTSSPSKGLLDVEGDLYNKAGTANYGFLSASGASGNAPASSQFVSIFANNTIWAGSYVIASSDERIKNIHGHSDSAADLQTLLGIRITDYTYRDTVANGSGPQKKVIAQQVETVFPQAVSRHTDVVPDIYQKAAIKDGWVQLATNLKTGERVRLIGGKKEGVFEVLESAPGRFRTSFLGDGEQVFVYGREVKDFRTVDYDAIAMLNVSATQELARRLMELESKAGQVAALQQQVAELSKKAAQVDTLARQMADLRKLVTQLADAAKISKLTAGAGGTQPSTLTTASVDH